MRAGNFSIALFIVMLCVSNSTMAQGDGARFYWKGLVGNKCHSGDYKLTRRKCKSV